MKLDEIQNILNTSQTPLQADIGVTNTLLEESTIDTSKLPIVKNPDGSVSTVATTTVGIEDGKYINIPTVYDGKHHSVDEAVKHAFETKQHLGVYSSKESAEQAAQKLHEDEAKRVLPAKENPVEETLIDEPVNPYIGKVGLVEGAKQNAFSMGWNKVMHSGGIFGHDYDPTPEERRDALKKLNGNIDQYESVLAGSDNQEQFQYNLEQMLDHNLYLEAYSQADLADKALSFIGDIGWNPLNVIPFAGGSSAVARVAYGATVGAISGQMQNQIAGTDNNVVVDLTVGAIAGGTIEAAAKGIAKFKGGASGIGKAGSHSKGALEDLAVGRPINLRTPTGDYLIAKVEKGSHKVLPTWTAQGARDQLPEDDKILRPYYDSLTGSERGYFNGTEKGKKFNATNKKGRKKVSQGFTASEYKQRYLDEGRTYVDNSGDYTNALLKTHRRDGLNRDSLDVMVRKRRAGHATPLDGEEDFEKLVKNYDDFYGDSLRGGQLRDAKIIATDYVDPITGKSIAVRHEGVKYEPFQLSRNKWSDYRGNFKGTPEQVTKILKEKFAKLLMQSVKDPIREKNFRSAYEAELMGLANKGVPVEKLPTFDDWFSKEAYKAAEGYANQGRAIENGFLDSNETKGYFAYQRSRLDWDTSIEDADGFSIDQLRASCFETIQSYNHSTSCDLGIANVFGVTNRGKFKDKLRGAVNAFGEKTQVGDETKDMHTKALKAMMNAYYGNSGIDGTESQKWLYAISDFIRNLTFVDHSSYMGYLNLFEVAEGLRQFGPTFFFKGIPGLGDTLYDWSKGGMDKLTRRHFLNETFGLDIVRQCGVGEVYEHELGKYGGNAYKAMLTSGGRMLSIWSPATKILNATQRSISKAAQGEFMQELTMFAHGRGLEKEFFSEETIRRLDIPKARFDKLLKSIKDSTTCDSKGRLSFDEDLWQNNIIRDPENYMTIRRMGKYVRDEVIQSVNLEDTFLWQGSNSSWFMNMLFQFKTFSVRSWNKRASKSFMKMQEGDALGQALLWMTSGALGTLSMIGQTCGVAAGMNDEQRSKYLISVFGVDNLEDADGSTYAQVALNGFLRGNMGASLSTLMSILGIKASLKSSGDEGAYMYNSDKFFKVKNAHEIMRSNIPVYNTGFSLIEMLFADIPNLINSTLVNPDDFSYEEVQKIKKRFGRNVKANIPNIPVAQQQVVNLITDQQDE